jgi:cation transport ATPase
VKLSFEELLTVLFLTESSSEHPIAKAMVSKAKIENPRVESDDKFKLQSFTNINGEGVVASILSQLDRSN